MLLSLSLKAVDIVDGSYMTYDGPTLRYCELVPEDFTLTFHVYSALLSLGHPSMSTYFGMGFNLMYNHMNIPAVTSATWTFQGATMAYVLSDRMRRAPLVDNGEDWVIYSNVANKAIVEPADPLQILLTFQSIRPRSILRIRKDLEPSMSLFTVNSATLSPNTALKKSCLTINFTTNCHMIEQGTQFEFVVPSFNDNANSNRHIFSNKNHSCHDDITFPYQNSPECTITDTGVIINKMFNTSVSETNHEVEICNVTAPPFGNAYPVEFYLTTSNGLRYAYSAFDLNTDAPAQLAVTSSSFANEVINEDFDLVFEAKSQAAISYSHNFEIWLDFNYTWNEIEKVSLQFTNLSNNTDQYFFNVAPVSTGIFKVTIDNTNLDLHNGFKLRVSGIRNPSEIGNHKFHVELKKPDGIPIIAPLDVFFSVFAPGSNEVHVEFEDKNLNQLTDANVSLLIPHLSLINKMTTLIITFGNSAVIKNEDFAGIEGKTNFSYTNYQISESSNQITLTNFFLDQPPDQDLLVEFKLKGIWSSAIDAEDVAINMRVLEDDVEKWNQDGKVNFSKVQFNIISNALTVNSQTFNLRIDFNYENLADFDHNFRIKLPSYLKDITNNACVTSSNLPGYSSSQQCIEGLINDDEEAEGIKSILIQNLLDLSSPSTDYFIVINGTVPSLIDSRLPFAIDIVNSENPDYEIDPTISVSAKANAEAMFNCGDNCAVCKYLTSSASCEICDDNYVKDAANNCVIASENSMAAVPLFLLGKMNSNTSNKNTFEGQKAYQNDDDDFDDKRGSNIIIKQVINKVPILAASLGATMILNNYIVGNSLFQNIGILTTLTYIQLSSFKEIFDNGLNTNQLSPSQINSMMVLILNSLVGLLAVFYFKHALIKADIKSNSLLLTITSIIIGPSTVIGLMLKAQSRSNEIYRGLKIILSVLITSQIIRSMILLNGVNSLQIYPELCADILISFAILGSLIFMFVSLDYITLNAKDGLDSKANDIEKVEKSPINEVNSKEENNKSVY